METSEMDRTQQLRSLKTGLQEIMRVLERNLEESDVFYGVDALVKRCNQLAKELGLPIPVVVESGEAPRDSDDPESLSYGELLPYRIVRVTCPYGDESFEVHLDDSFWYCDRKPHQHGRLRAELLKCLAVWVIALENGMMQNPTNSTSNVQVIEPKVKLKGKKRKAFDFIANSSQKVKGRSVAAHVGVKPPSFYSHYASPLKEAGVQNDGGYFIPKDGT